jgi:hypothetical protein
MGDRTETLPTPVTHLVPRRLKAKRPQAMGCGLWFGRLFILPHMIIGAVMIVCLILSPFWVLLGKDTEAQVVRRWTTRGDNSTGYHVEYVYRHGGDELRGESKVSRGFYDALKRLDDKNVEAEGPPHTVRVRHLGVGRLRYADALEEGESGWKVVGFLLLITPFWNGITGVFVALFWVVPWRSKRVYRWGKAVRGTITGKHTGSGTPVRHKLEYEFGLPDGRKVRGRMSVSDASDWNDATVGEPVTVLYLGRNGRRSVVYEYGDFESK